MTTPYRQNANSSEPSEPVKKQRLHIDPDVFLPVVIFSVVPASFILAAILSHFYP